MMKKMIKKLINSIGGRFSRELGIDLSKGNSTEIFKWFLASKLFGARIGTHIAINTYKEFERRGVITPGKILQTGWDGLVGILDDGGYVRYDFFAATKLLGIMKNLKEHYGVDSCIIRSNFFLPSFSISFYEIVHLTYCDVTVNIF